ncbi:MAG: 30S ribosomal protein S13 [bacterium]|nr:30S ribosomal protein S13 [bacterium]
MARIAGIELPNNKKIVFSLPYIYGIGPTLAKKVVETAKIDPDKRVKDLSEEELSKIQKAVEQIPVEGDLRRMVGQNIRRLEDIGTYRGLRHRKSLPVRGQRTKSNSRTKRGKRVTIGAMKKEVLVKMEQAATTTAKKETK